MNSNISLEDSRKIASFLGTISQPARLSIMMVIAEQEACVCHLEAALGMRQASISQHLMILRKADVVSTHRIGRNIFYSLTEQSAKDLIIQAARLVKINPQELEVLPNRPIPGCCCPQCNPGMDPELTCRKRKTNQV